MLTWLSIAATLPFQYVGNQVVCDSTAVHENCDHGDAAQKQRPRLGYPEVGRTFYVNMKATF
ncbi:hypothetical protein HNR60_001677 [Rhodopseudomonas rhenobacensis]|uniref:Uncharacterized protein n=1 Tax=Rhodopseudomonas rhenobacensis TaxID=87461 RepID=A0A7W7Z2P7_9BRAD|nr:hypothetical protein [Rhodopseudomonas rhenobacensis]